MILIGLGSKARQGKDTAGEAIVNHFNGTRYLQIQHGLRTTAPNARIFKFADELYRICREEYGMVGKDPALLQRIGDGRRNEFGLTYWIDKLEATMKGFDGIAVITDVRYINEADWIKSKGGWTVQVSRVNEDGSAFISPDRDPNFPSEIQLDGYNFDAYIKSKSSALTAEYAITLAEYIRGLRA